MNTIQKITTNSPMIANSPIRTTSRLKQSIQTSINIHCVPKSDPPPNVWLWQVQTCTVLHIINHAQALMYFEYCHQILYKSIVPFSRFSIFTKCCQKGELPAALLTYFPCALTVFCVNVQHFFQYWCPLEFHVLGVPSSDFY